MANDHGGRVLRKLRYRGLVGGAVLGALLSAIVGGPLFPVGTYLLAIAGTTLAFAVVGFFIFDLFLLNTAAGFPMHAPSSDDGEDDAGGDGASNNE